MTLSTRILIPKPVPAEELFQFVRSELLGATTEAVERRAQGVHEKWISFNVGLPAWVEVSYCPDGPLKADPDYPDAWPEAGPWYAEVWMDTSYSYQNERGGGCGDLHAWIVQEVGAWLLERGCTGWWWYEEHTGEWHPWTVSPDGKLGDAQIGAIAEVVG